MFHSCAHSAWERWHFGSARKFDVCSLIDAREIKSFITKFTILALEFENRDTVQIQELVESVWSVNINEWSGLVVSKRSTCTWLVVHLTRRPERLRRYELIDVIRFELSTGVFPPFSSPAFTTLLELLTKALAWCRVRVCLHRATSSRVLPGALQSERFLTVINRKLSPDRSSRHSCAPLECLFALHFSIFWICVIFWHRPWG